MITSQPAQKTTQSTQSIQSTQSSSSSSSSPIANDKNRSANRRLKCQSSQDPIIWGGSDIEASIDYIRGVALIKDWREFMDFIMMSTKGELVIKMFEPKNFGAWFQHSASSPCGCQFGFNDKDINGFYRVIFTLSGKPCRALGLMGNFHLIRNLKNKFAVGFTRIDLKLRVGRDLLDFDNIKDAGVNLQFDTFRKGKNNKSPFSFSVSSSVDDDGNVTEHPTYYFGSRQSDYLARFYDPAFNHGVLNAIDFEGEFKGKKADEIANIFCRFNVNDESHYVALAVGSLACSQFDFKDMSVGDRSSRCPLLDWWSRFLEAVETSPKVLKISVASVPKTFERFLGFFERQVLSGLAAYCHLIGIDEVLDFIRGKIEDRIIKGLSREWMSLIEFHKNVYENCEN